MSISAPAWLLLGSLPLLALSEWNSTSYTGTAVFKMLCSTAFLSKSLLLPYAEWSGYHSLIAIGLGFSLIGDFFLIPSRREFRELKHKALTPDDSCAQRSVSISFQVGIFAFAAAHVSYSLAFLQNSGSVSLMLFSVTFLGTLGAARWLGVVYPQRGSSLKHNPLNLNIPIELRNLVFFYAVIIGTMFAAATSTSPLAPVNLLNSRAIGAAMFVLSDLFVARNAFGSLSPSGSRGWIEIFVGYAFYFWAQMVIASTLDP
ncbi:unnamed protein product [Penicillium olsonii]|uniref:YhhN-like protein n=1 Tax=Penicillium olsonii TaxID=99116 RepID=A0A9W4I0W3_PENOL|nr:unnamed protein product [Penicillium olsonii]CAG8184190.1 unnamed protein product [Penicillium olsonii]